MKEIETWRDLLDYLQSLTPQQLDQKAQYIISSPNCDESVALGPVIHVGTVREMFKYSNSEEIEETRSSYDNEHHPEDIVLLTDCNPFGEDGSVACDLLTGEKIYPRDHVLWGGRKFNELTSGDQI